MPYRSFQTARGSPLPSLLLKGSKERRKIKESVKKSGRILFGQPSICIPRRGGPWEPIHQKQREEEASLFLATARRQLLSRTAEMFRRFSRGVFV